ncbi:RNA polymerase sigma factor [Peristeroidobacter soli]|uniref:RNA polymerase sigma factor n=1 Tax=Peristeroidobacter soli TaxID=2497877 RepID=UPI001300A8BC|nr:RNA polymerase sigma factor [Peristeroidobacter soli]
MSEGSAEEAALAGSEMSLSVLYGSYRKELVAFVRSRFGGGPPEPEDVAQQAFVNFATVAPSQVLNPRAFLYRTAVNIVLNYRKRERIGRRFLTPMPETEELQQVRDEISPEKSAQAEEHYALVEAAIRAMPQPRRSYLLLNRVEGLSYAEIARRAGLSESVIRKHVALAVRECGRMLLEVNDAGGSKRGGR